MSNEKMREDFEAWVIKQNVCVKYGAKLIQCRDGSYKDYRINDRWNSWKASRDSLCVDVPEFGPGYADARLDAFIDDLYREFESIGVRYK